MPLDWTLPLAGLSALRIDRPLVMAIVNATPDSFSDGGQLGIGGPGTSPDTAALAARLDALVAAGADILDVGGESTRPGHVPVSAEEEVARVLPVVRAARAAHPALPISIDTRKAAVARAALAAGASFVNDVSGLSDPAMAKVVLEAASSVVLMRHEPLDLAGGDVVEACRLRLAALVGKAKAAGLREGQLLVDPGVGFGDPPGADPRLNLQLVASASRYGGGRPVVVGASRKRFIGTLTGVTEPSSRVSGSVAAAILAVQGGAAIVRVHDVLETVQALKVLRAL